MTAVGFIGLGAMGKAMAKNILKSGYDLTVFDVLRQPVEELNRLGAHEAQNPRELASRADVIFTMVRDDAQTEEVIYRDDGVLKGAKRGATIVISSTVSPALCKKIAEDASRIGVRVLDSPVSGGEVGAQEGTLSLMVGGEEQTFKKVKPILQKVAKNIRHVGSVGEGEVAKLVVNVIHEGNLLSTIDGLRFAERAGIPLEAALDIVRDSTGNSWVAQNWEWMAAGQNSKWRRTSMLMAKDMQLALEYAKKIGVELPIISQLDKYEVYTPK